MGFTDSHYTNSAEAFDDGQAMTPDAFAALLELFARHGPPARPATVLDLGCGTGRFTAALADLFGGPAYGVDPNAAMRAVARQRRPHPRVSYLEGRAEAVPLPSASTDLALMYEVVHHVDDHAAMAGELARVLRPGGRALLCTVVPEHGGQPVWADYFPRAFTLQQVATPSLAVLRSLIEDAGLEITDILAATVAISPDLAAYRQRLSHLAISALSRLGPDELADGFRRLDQDVAAGSRPGPVQFPLTVIAAARLR